MLGTVFLEMPPRRQGPTRLVSLRSPHRKASCAQATPAVNADHDPSRNVPVRVGCSGLVPEVPSYLASVLLLELLPLTCGLYHAPDFGLAAGGPPQTVRVHGATYHFDVESAGGFIGFFDWLRADPASIVGVRLCPLNQPHFQPLLGRYPYTTAVNFVNTYHYAGQYTEIWFEHSAYNPALSGDQDFTSSFVYRNADQLLLTLPTNALCATEWAGLLARCQLLQP